jgi:hypothetical protein
VKTQLCFRPDEHEREIIAKYMKRLKVSGHGAITKAMSRIIRDAALFQSLSK